MLFSKVFAPAVLAATALAATSPQQVADALNGLTQKSNDLSKVAQTLTIFNTGQFIFGAGPIPTIATGVQTIVSTIATVVQQIAGLSTIANRDVAGHARDFSVEESGLEARGADADLIFDAFSGFVDAHQGFISILIAKIAIIKGIPLIGALIVSLLSGLEPSIDSLTVALSNAVPGRSADITTVADKVEGTIAQAISGYQGI